jgi:hypothetical protein
VLLERRVGERAGLASPNGSYVAGPGGALSRTRALSFTNFTRCQARAEIFSPRRLARAISVTVAACSATSVGVQRKSLLKAIPASASGDGFRGRLRRLVRRGSILPPGSPCGAELCRARHPDTHSRMLAKALALAVAGSSLVHASALCSQWSLATDFAPWGNRSDHAQVTLDDQSVLVIGGGDYSSSWKVFNDVWRSTDLGVTWTPLTTNAPWAARAYLTVTKVNTASGGERLVLVGGGHCIGPFITSFCQAFEWFADVWVSDDGGTTWTETVANVSSPFSARGGHAATAMNNDTSVFVMGGMNSIGQMNDAWRSDDGGMSWVEVRPNSTANGANSTSGDASRAEEAYWSCVSKYSGSVLRGGSSLQNEGEVLSCSAPSGFLPVVSFQNLLNWKGALWWIAGVDVRSYLNTVWRSTDGGGSWELLVSSAPWRPRALPSTTIVTPSSCSLSSACPEALVMTGGSPIDGGWALQDVWSSGDGVTWEQESAKAEWPARAWQTMTTVTNSNGSFAVMTGGWTWDLPERIEWTYYRDVWVCKA